MTRSSARLCDPGRDLGLWTRWTWATLSPDFGATAAGVIARPFAGRIGELRAARQTSHDGESSKDGSDLDGTLRGDFGIASVRVHDASGCRGGTTRDRGKGHDGRSDNDHRPRAG